MSSCSKTHICNCGTGPEGGHVIGAGGCRRRMVSTPRHNPDRTDTHQEWTITQGPHAPYKVSDYTLKHQRGYHRHPCGCWSDWNGSVNSLPDET